MNHDSEVERLLGEYYAREGSESAESFVAQHPEHAEALLEHFALNDVIEQAFEPRADLPERIGPFRIDGELGTGGMGTVYRAVVEEPERGLDPGVVVALKVVHPHLFRRRGFFKRFLREAELGRRIEHPNVVRTLDVDAVETEGRPLHYLVMEYVEGQTLRELLADEPGVSEELARHIGCEVAKALAAIHGAGAVHRDLKPENVLITPDHVVKVMDLGVARLVEEQVRLSQTGAFVGSLHYAAPEQFGGGAEVDARADLHGLGLLLYEITTGTNPYAGEDVGTTMRRILTEHPRKAGELNPQLSPFFEEVLVRLLEKEPADRFQTARDVLRVLEAAERSTWWSDRAVEVRVATRRPLRRIHIPRETAVYGREDELAALYRLYDGARSGKGRAVLVEGEAGIGKTRLVDEFVARLRQGGEDVNFLFASYPPGGAATAAGAFTAAYLEQLGPEGLQASLETYLPQTPLLIPAFAALLRGDAPPADVDPLTKDSLQTCFVHLTRNLAAERPTIVLIDDLHFAPEEGRALFSSLALGVPGHRVLLIGTTRPGLPESWTADLSRLEQTTTLTLPRLGAKDLVRLLGDSFRSERLAERLAGKIAVKSDGNPFFVFEIIQGLREDGLLVQREDGSWDTSEALEEIKVPSTILDLVNARVAKLTENERDLLDVAVCAGFQFDPTLLSEVLGLGAIPVLRSLGQIERAHRLIRSAGRNYVFDHHQVQEALYGTLNQRLREAYHAGIADVLLARAGGPDRDPQEIDGELCSLLCGHCLDGGQGEKAIPYLDSALDYLDGRYLNDRANALTRRALAVPDLLTGRHRFDLLLRLSSRLGIQGHREEQWEVIAELRRIAEASEEAYLRATVENETGWLLKELGRYDEALAHYERSRDIARAAGDVRGEAMALGNRGIVLRYRGRLEEARACHEQSLEVFVQLGDERNQGAARGSLGVVYLILGRYEEARALFEQNLSSARKRGNRRGEGNVLGNLALVLEAEGHLEEALAHHGRSLEMAREMGDRAAQAATLGGLGNTLRLMGRTAEAREHYERQRAIAVEIGGAADEARAVGNLGIVEKNLGFLGNAKAHYERQLSLVRARGLKESECVALANLGAVLDYLGQTADGREALEASLQISREIGAKHPEGFGLINLSAIAEQEGDTEEALRLARASLTLRKELGSPHGILDTLTRIGELHWRRGEHEEAASALREAMQQARDAPEECPTDLIRAILSCLPGTDSDEAGDIPETSDPLGMLHTRYFNWKATSELQYLRDAKQALDHLVEHAPAACREAMIENVVIHREIMEAWAEHAGGE